MIRTNFSVATWKGHAGVRPLTSNSLHVAIVLSRNVAWSVDEAIYLVRNVPELADFAGLPARSVFVVPAPPWTGDAHPLSRTPPKRDPFVFGLGVQNRRQYLLDRETVLSSDDWSPEGALYNRTTAPAEYRYLIIPSASTIFSRELHPSTLQYEFRVVGADFEERFTYQQLWNRCPIVKAIPLGYAGCPSCDLHGATCIRTWFDEEVASRGYASTSDLNITEIAQERYSRNLTKFLYDGSSFYVPADRAAAIYAQFAPLREGRDVAYGHRKTTLTFYPSSMVAGRTAWDMVPKVTDRDPANLMLHARAVKEAEKEQAEKTEGASNTKRLRSQTCGTGKNACVLRGDNVCNRWRNGLWRTGSCKTRHVDEESTLYRGIEPLKNNLEYTDLDFQVAMHMAGDELFIINPSTGREIQIVYGGFRVSPKPAVGKRVLTHEFWARDGSTNAEVVASFSDWNDALRWLRTYSPPNFTHWLSRTRDAQRIYVDDLVKVAYAECAVHIWLTTNAMYSSHSTDVRVIAPVRRQHRNKYPDVYTCSDTEFQMIKTNGGTLHIGDVFDLYRYTGYWFSFIPA